MMNSAILPTILAPPMMTSTIRLSALSAWKNKATVSLLQRRLNVGYARAARIMELLEENGIVGPFAGSNPREVLPTDEPDDVEGSDDE